MIALSNGRIRVALGRDRRDGACVELPTILLSESAIAGRITTQ